MNKTRINNMIKLLESYSNKKVILKEDEDEFDLNSFLKPNPNQLERYDQFVKLRERELENIKLGLEKINKAFENKEWKNEEEELFLKSFYKSEVKVDLEKYLNEIFIMKNSEKIAYQNLKYKWFWIDYQTIWKVFKYKFHWNYDETQSFMKIMLNKYFKLKDYIPNRW